MSAVLSSVRCWLHANSEAIDAVLLDVDGVLMTSRRPLSGAADLIAWLRREGLAFVLLTNDACHSAQEKVDHLASSGFCFEPDDLVSSGHALAELVAERGWEGRRFFRMGLLGRPCYGAAAGLEMTADLGDLERCDGVLVGEKAYDWESTITAVFNYLRRHPTAPLVVPNPDEFFAVQGLGFHPASGAVARFLVQLCAAAGHVLEPIYLGKPFAPVFRHAQLHLARRMGHVPDAGRILMVGDSLNGDIRGGASAGMRTALLLTGITSGEALASSDIRPDVVFQNL